jgi:holo-[acyl-carrier protein] synthase
VIVGIGTDICSIERLTKSLYQTPNLKARLFTEAEQELSAQSLAGRFAAKEALAKALGDPRLLIWNEVEVLKNDLGKPEFVFHGKTNESILQAGVSKSWLSISHDAGVAIAMVVLEAK